MMQRRLEEINQLMSQLLKEYPEETKAFVGFMKASQSGPALSAKHKELINVALSITARCGWCIALHVRGALDAGATRDEIMEAAFQAVLMNGGPALMHMTPVVRALDEFETA